MITENLESALFDIWEDESSCFGFAIIDKITGGVIQHQGDKEFNIASSYKAYVLGELLKGYEEGKLSLDEKVCLTSETRIFDSSFTDELPDGSHLSYLDLAKAMIEYSDNTATELIQSKIGPEKIKETLQILGLTNTRFPDSLHSMDVISSIHGKLDFSLSQKFFNGELGIVSSPFDLANFYDTIFNKNFFNNVESTQLFKEIMSLEDLRQKTVWPSGVKCYRKSGNIELDYFYSFSLAGAIQKDQFIFPFSLCVNFEDENKIVSMLQKFKMSFGIMKEYILEGLS